MPFAQDLDSGRQCLRRPAGMNGAGQRGVAERAANHGTLQLPPVPIDEAKEFALSRLRTVDMKLLLHMLDDLLIGTLALGRNLSTCKAQAER